MAFLRRCRGHRIGDRIGYRIECVTLLEVALPPPHASPCWNAALRLLR
jgi:hypothetical protein